MRVVTGSAFLDYTSFGAGGQLDHERVTTSHGQRFFDRELFSRHYADHCYKRRRDNNSVVRHPGKNPQESTVRGYHAANIGHLDV